MPMIHFSGKWNACNTSSRAKLTFAAFPSLLQHHSVIFRSPYFCPPGAHSTQSRIHFSPVCQQFTISSAMCSFGGKIHPWRYSQSPVSQFSRFVHRFLNNFTAVICDFQSHCSHYWFLHIPPLFFEAGCVLLCSCKHIFPRWWFSLIFLHEFAHALQMSARTGKNQRVFPRRFRIAPVSADLRGLFLEISSVD